METTKKSLSLIIFLVLFLNITGLMAESKFSPLEIKEIYKQVSQQLKDKDIPVNINDIKGRIDQNIFSTVDGAIEKLVTWYQAEKLSTQLLETFKDKNMKIEKKSIIISIQKKLLKNIEASAAVLQVGKEITKDYDKANSYFNKERLNILIALVIFWGVILYMIKQAKAGKKMFVRKIAGLNAIDEAVGRATEMGKPVLFVPGIYDMDDMPTIAGITILGHVSSKTAEYETDLMVPVAAPIVFSTAREIIKESYLKVGRPDLFQEDCVRFLTTDQFGYAAGCNGIMMRDKPATIFYMGTFYAESLILAETGQGVGAIQIAGTTQSSQLPFFVAACDYTLIGEELYAASAYFSREPMQLGSLKGQDMGKLACMIAILVGVALETLALLTKNEALSIKNFFETK